MLMAFSSWSSRPYNSAGIMADLRGLNADLAPTLHPRLYLEAFLESRCAASHILMDHPGFLSAVSISEFLEEGYLRALS